jgi:hypothetical protein
MKSKTETCLPHRALPRSDILEPIVKKSNNETPDLVRVAACSITDRPDESRTDARMDNAEPICTNWIADKPLRPLAKERRDRDEAQALL